MGSRPMCGAITSKPKTVAIGTDGRNIIWGKEPGRCQNEVDEPGELCWLHDPRRELWRCGAPLPGGRECGTIVKHPRLLCSKHREEATHAAVARNPMQARLLLGYTVRQLGALRLLAGEMEALSDG